MLSDSDTFRRPTEWCRASDSSGWRRAWVIEVTALTDKKTATIGVGCRGKPGPGRPKGMPNKLTRAAKEAFGLAFERLGGVKALTEWGRENRSEFYKLYARLIPVDTQHSGSTQLHVRVSYPSAPTAKPP